MNKILFITMLMTLIALNAHAYDNGDFQIWNTDYQDIKWNSANVLGTKIRIAF